MDKNVQELFTKAAQVLESAAQRVVQVANEVDLAATMAVAKLTEVADALNKQAGGTGEMSPQDMFDYILGQQDSQRVKDAYNRNRDAWLSEQHRNTLKTTYEEIVQNAREKAKSTDWWRNFSD